MAKQSQSLNATTKALKRKLATELAKDVPDFDVVAELSERYVAEDPNALRFTIDAGHIKRLGQELVAKGDTALAELIKNAYDADATDLTVTFVDAEKEKGSLVISDNGTGMSEADIRNGWMRLSTGSKIDKPVSPRYMRPRAGRKGLGRFAAQRLGEELVLETGVKGSRTGLRVRFNWDGDFKQGASLGQVSNSLERFDKRAEEEGTRLTIKGLRDTWPPKSIDRVWQSVLLLQPPFPVTKIAKGGAADPGFALTMNGRKQADTKEEWNSKQFLDYATARISGSVNDKGIARFRVRSKRLDFEETFTSEKRYPLVGAFEFQAHYFIFDAGVVPGVSMKDLTAIGRQYGGIRVYRNGFRVTPYGDPTDDWLRLAFDTARRTLLMPANNQNFFGQVLLNVEENPLLEETSSREGLIENEAFSELQDVLRTGLEWAAIRIAWVRGRKHETGKSKIPRPDTLPRPSVATGQLLERVSSLVTDAKTGRERGEQLTQELKIILEAQKAFEAETVATRVRSARYEEMLRILASLGMSVAVFGHEMRGAVTILGTELARLEREARKLVPSKLDFAAAKDNVARVADLGKYITDIMSHAESRALANVALHSAIKRFVDQFSSFLNAQGVEFSTEVKPQHLRTVPIHRSEVDSVLFNFLTNSLKAIRLAQPKKAKIKISASRQNDFVVISFQDNGIGVPNDKRERIFEAFYTTTEYQVDDIAGPGTGLGLKIVSDIAAVYGGWVKVGNPDAGFVTRMDFAVPIDEKQK